MGNVKVCLYSIGEQRSPSKRNVDWLTDWHGSYGLCKMSFGKGCRTYLEYYDFVGTEVIGSGKNEVMWNPLKMYWLKSHLCYTFKKKKKQTKNKTLCAEKKSPADFMWRLDSSSSAQRYWVWHRVSVGEWDGMGRRLQSVEPWAGCSLLPELVFSADSWITGCFPPNSWGRSWFLHATTVASCVPSCFSKFSLVLLRDFYYNLLLLRAVVGFHCGVQA